jgi:hypothetical protein
MNQNQKQAWPGSLSQNPYQKDKSVVKAGSDFDRSREVAVLAPSIS